MPPAREPAVTEDKLPDHVTMGLLPYLNANALDVDYAAAAARRDPASAARRHKVGAGGAIALLVFGILAMTAAVQTSRNSVTDVRERSELSAQIANRKAALDRDQNRIAAMRKENRRLDETLLGRDEAAQKVLDNLELLGMRNGNTAVRGPGVRVVVDDAPGADGNPLYRVLDSDLQRLVNALWEAGAEAIAVNGERLTNLSAIRAAGQAITVNFRSLSRPYTVQAIGDPKSLPGRFGESTGGQAWLDLQRRVGLKFTMVVEQSMKLPGLPTPTLRHAKPLDESGGGAP